MRTISPRSNALFGSRERQLGAISGRVLTTGGVAVFGAHVTAVDGDGVVQCGVVTERDGTYTMPCLPPGPHRSLRRAARRTHDPRPSRQTPTSTTRSIRS